MDFFNKLVNDYNIKLNNEQKQAVKHFKNPGLTLAIPGSGKTTILLCRLMYLKKVKNINPKNILTLTFSKASALDMKSRFKELFPNETIHLNFSTIHRFSYIIVRKYFKYKKINFKLIEGKNNYIKVQLLRDLYQKYNHDSINEEDLETLMNDIGYVNNMMITEDFPSEIDHFDQIFNQYKKIKQSKNYIDFDDMLILALKVLKKYDKILKHYSEKFKFIQLDEAQDTSKLQYEIINLLAQKHKNLFMVADDDQSIYGFRGAYPDYLLNFKKTYKNAKIYYLKKNYRSSYEIINLCNKFIAHNDNRYDKQMVNNNDKNSKVKLVKFDTKKTRDQYILENLQPETAILYRNNLSALPLINHFEKHNIEFNIKGKSMHFFNHWLVKDFKAFFNFILINQDLESFERIYYKINGYISKKMINYLKLNIRDQNVFDCLLNFPKLKKYQKRTLRTIRDTFDDLKTQQPIDIIETIKYELNYLNHINEFAQLSNSNYDNLKEKLSILQELSRGLETPFEFLNKLETLEKFIKHHENEDSNNIYLSTMHSAKGLEFKNVKIIDVYDKILPQQINTIEEDRRLLYVALSRAEKDLEILSCNFRNGKINSKKQFINELKNNETLEIMTYKKERKNSSNFETGDLIEHKHFGKGKIVSINNLNYTIEFEDSIRHLSKEVCINKNLIQKLDLS